MVNKVVNDFGQTVTAVGSPNSRMRIAATRPKLIESLMPVFHEIPVSAAIVDDLVNNGIERWEAKIIAEIVEQKCCSQCHKGGMMPPHFGSVNCKSGSIASGGTKQHCSCDICF